MQSETACKPMKNQAIVSTSQKKSSVIRKSTVKAPAVQSAITLRRANGQSKRQIAKDLNISRNTVTSVLELNQVEQQIAQARQGAIELAPKALTAIDRDLTLPGGGALGLRLLNDIGAIGEDAIESVRRNSVRSMGAINVLVQPGATVTVNADSNLAPQPVGGQYSQHNAPLADATPICSEEPKAENNRIGTVDQNITTCDTGSTIPLVGKHPKAGPRH